MLYFVFYCYLCVSCDGSVTLVGEERAIFLLAFTYYMVSVRRGFLFVLVLGMGCIILLWHSMGRPYNYFKISNFHL